MGSLWWAFGCQFLTGPSNPSWEFWSGLFISGLINESKLGWPNRCYSLTWWSHVHKDWEKTSKCKLHCAYPKPGLHWLFCAVLLLIKNVHWAWARFSLEVAACDNIGLNYAWWPDPAPHHFHQRARMFFKQARPKINFQTCWLDLSLNILGPAYWAWTSFCQLA